MVCVPLSQLLQSREPPKRPILSLHELIPDAVDSSSDFSGDDYDDYGRHSRPIDDEDDYASGSESGSTPDYLVPNWRSRECDLIKFSFLILLFGLCIQLWKLFATRQHANYMVITTSAFEQTMSTSSNTTKCMCLN